MTPPPPPDPTKRWRAGLLIVLLAGATLYALAPFLMGVVGSAILYVVVAPVYARLVPRMGRSGAALVVVVGTAVAVAVPGVWLIITIVHETPGALASLQHGPLLARLSGLHIGEVDLGTQFSDASGAIVAWASKQTLSLLATLAHATIDLVIALFGLYFLLQSAEETWIEVQSYLPFSDDSGELLRLQFHRVTVGTLLGTAMTAIAQGCVVGVGFWMVGFPSAVFWGVIAGVLSVIPLIGGALVWGPAVIVLFAEGRTGAGIAFAAICVVIAWSVEHLIRPLINSRISNIHPMMTLLGAAAGLELLGFPGVLIGPLAISYVFVLLDIYRREYRGKASRAAPSP